MVAAVSVGDASSFQAQYQQLVENWVQTWLALQEQQKLDGNKDGNEVKEGADVWDELGEEEVEITQKLPDNSEKLLYGKNERGNQVNLLTPDLITALERAELGDMLDGWGSITVRAGNEIFFQSDESGKVIVNQRVDVRDVARVDNREQVTSVQQFYSEGSSVSSNTSKRREDVFEEDFSAQLRQDDLIFDRDYLRKKDDSVSQDIQDTVGFQKDRDAYLEVLAELMVPLVLEAMRESEPSSSTQNRETAAFPENLPEKDEKLGLFEDFFVASSITQSDRERQESARTEEVLKPVIRSNGQTNEKVCVGIEVPSQLETGQTEARATQTGLNALLAATAELRDSPVKQVLQETTHQMQSALLEQQSSPPSVAMQQLVERRLQSKDNPNWWQQLTAKVEVMVTEVRDSFTQHRAASTLKQFANSMGLLRSEPYEGANYTFSKQGRQYTLSDKQGNPLVRFESTVFGVKVDKSLPPLSEADLAKIEQLRTDITTGIAPGGAFTYQAVSEGRRLAQIQRIQTAMSGFAAQTPNADIQVEGSTYNWRANSKGSAIIQDKQGNVLLAAGNGYMRSSMSDKQLSDFEQMLTVASSQTKFSQKKASGSQLMRNSRAKDKGLELG